MWHYIVYVPADEGLTPVLMGPYETYAQAMGSLAGRYDTLADGGMARYSEPFEVPEFDPENRYGMELLEPDTDGRPY